jgi:hypothetical protein
LAGWSVEFGDNEKTERLTVPEVDVDVGNGFASVDINQLDVKVGVDTLLGLAKIPANIFTIDV